MFTYKDRVGYSRVDCEGKLSISNLVHCFQDATNFQTESLDFDQEYYRQNGCAWIMIFWQIKIIKRPIYNEEIEVGTFPYSFKRFTGYRNFFLKDLSGEYMAVANSIWSYFNLKENKFVIPDKEMIEKYPMCEKIDMDYADRKVNISGEGIYGEKIHIRKSDIDTNKHVNNVALINIALECVDYDLEIEELLVEYKKQVFLNSEIYPFIVKAKDCTLVSLRDKQEVEYLNMRIKFNQCQR